MVNRCKRSWDCRADFRAVCRAAALVVMALGTVVSAASDSGVPAAEQLAGVWQGQIELGQHAIWVTFRMETASPVDGSLTGCFDSPDQRVRDVPMTLTVDSRKVSAVIAALGAQFVGTLADDALREGEMVMTGVWEQGGAESNLVLQKVEFPEHLDPRNLVEYQVTAGTEAFPLPATVSLPIDQLSYPVAVILTGSGPNDRDGMLGPNRPYRDLAWGLGNHGVASIRLDKRTLHYSTPNDENPANIPYMEWEYVEDAVAAIELARNLPGAERVVLVGHSLGATVAPRIGVEAGADAVVMLAGMGRTMAEVSIDQNRYVAGQMEPAPELEQQVQSIIAFFEAVSRKEVPPETEVQPGLPVAYYYAVDSYQPQEWLGELTVPVLVVQGEEDFQTLLDRDYEVLRQQFGGREGYTFQSFPGLNHLLMESSGAATGVSDYLRPGFVDEAVLEFISEWILQSK